MLDMLALRDRLNQLEFKTGERRALIGRLTEMMAASAADVPQERGNEVSEQRMKQTVPEFLHELENNLAKHDLRLARGDDDPDELYAVQRLRQPRAIDWDWIREGINWVTKITTVVLEMILPGVVGMWLDRAWGTWFLAPLGLAVGVPLGIWHLILLARQTGRR